MTATYPLRNVENQLLFEEYHQLYLRVMASALRMYQKSKDPKLYAAIKDLGATYQEIKKDHERIRTPEERIQEERETRERNEFYDRVYGRVSPLVILEPHAAGKVKSAVGPEIDVKVMGCPIPRKTDENGVAVANFVSGEVVESGPEVSKDSFLPDDEINVQQALDELWGKGPEKSDT